MDILAAARTTQRLLATRHDATNQDCDTTDVSGRAALAAGTADLLRTGRRGSTHAFEGRFDLLAGVGAYAPILAIFGSLSVPAIVLILTVPALGVEPKSPAAIGLATGLLVVGMLGSLLGALAAAAIGAERLPTANLTAAAMYMAVPAMASVVSILGAFEVLVSLYAHTSSTLFGVIVGVGGAFGVFFAAFAVADSPSMGPAEARAHAAWLQNQRLQDRTQARRWAFAVILVALIPIALAIGLWLSNAASITPTPDRNNGLIGSGLGLAILFTGWSEIRATHAIDGKDKGLRLPEAFLSCFALGIYTSAVILFLPR